MSDSLPLTHVCINLSLTSYGDNRNFSGLSVNARKHPTCVNFWHGCKLIVRWIFRWNHWALLSHSKERCLYYQQSMQIKYYRVVGIQRRYYHGRRHFPSMYMYINTFEGRFRTYKQASLVPWPCYAPRHFSQGARVPGY